MELTLLILDIKLIFSILNQLVCFCSELKFYWLKKLVDKALESFQMIVSIFKLSGNKDIKVVLLSGPHFGVNTLTGIILDW